MDGPLSVTGITDDLLDMSLPSVRGNVSANKTPGKIHMLIFENHRTFIYYHFNSSESYP